MTDPSQPVQVATWQSLRGRPIPPADIVVIDEAHEWPAFYSKWIKDPAWAKTLFIGLSATPWKRGLGKYFDDLLIVTTTADLIREGRLSPFRVFAPSHPDLSKVKTVAGDYHEGQLAEVMSGATIVADVVENWLKHGESLNTLCFAVNRAHAKTLQQQFEQAGVRAGYIDAKTTVEEREAIGAALHRGEIRVVCSVGCLTTGIDWDCRCIILARPTKSEMLFTQIIGRGLRIADGKLDCKIFDHTNTHFGSKDSLGFVTDIHHDKLDDGRERAKAAPRERPKIRECGNKSCGFLMPAKWVKCPACGFLPERKCEVVTEDGELFEIGAKQGKKQKASLEEQQRWLCGLMRVAATRGYQHGWVSNQFREKFGHWPKGLAERIGPLDPDIANWVKSQQIRYAKRRPNVSEARA
jgi:superfamily II DNA or RNA helicase